MSETRRIRVMILASHYRADHVAEMKTYHTLNRTASTWNSALFSALRTLDVELHILQFYPVLRRYVIREDNVSYYYLPRIPKLDGFTSLAKKFRAQRLARAIQPDIIHGIGAEHGHVYAAIQKQWPSIITIHGYMKHINRLPGHNSLLKAAFMVPEEQKALLAATRIIAINGYMKDQFINNGCLADKITIIPNAINSLFLSGCNDENRRDIDIIIVGTLHRLKNQHVALSILAHYKKKFGASPSVTIVGAPSAASVDYHRELLALQAEHGLDNVHFAGNLGPSDLKALYCRSRILLHISEFEVDPMVISEALACHALPVVNPVAGMAYRIQHGVNGYYLNIADPEQAAADLAAILNNETERSKLANHGGDEVLAERSSQNVAAATLNAYRATLGDFLQKKSLTP